MKHRVLCAAVSLLFLLSCGGTRPLVPAPPAPSASSKPEVAEDDAEEEEEDDEDKADESPAPRRPSPPAAPAPTAAAFPTEPELPQVIFEAAEPSPAPKQMPTVAILSPAKNSVIPSSKVADTVVKLDVKGWPLTGGNHVQLLVDNRPYLRVDNLKRVIKLGELASDLGPGQHFVAAVLARGNLETVKPQGKKVPAAVVSFFVGAKGEVRWKEGSPLLLYSAPQDGPAPASGLLVDFYVLNAQLARGRNVVHASVSGPGLRAAESLSEWKPWRVRNARPGLYVIQVALYRFEASELHSESATSVTYVSNPVPGPWSSHTREFTVTAP